MRSDVKHLSPCGYESLCYCQTHRESCPKIWDVCPYHKSKTPVDKICRNHDHIKVVYKQKVVKGCPLCELERENINLRIKINAFNFKLGGPVR